MADTYTPQQLNPFATAPLSQAFTLAWDQWLRWRDELPSALDPQVQVAQSAEQAGAIARRLWRSAFAAVGEANGHQAKATLYAFVALVDEHLLFNDWPGQALWLERPLEARLFGSSSAGDRLPVAIGRLLLTRDPATRDLANVYLLCLVLGFEGRLRIANGKAIHEKWRRALFAFTRQRPATDSQWLLQLERPTQVEPRQLRTRRSLPDSLRLGMAIGLGLLLLLGVSQLFWWNITQRLEPAIEQSLSHPLAERAL